MWLHNSNWGLIFFLFFLSFFYSQLVKKRSPAVPCPGQTRTLACSLWMRRLWSTTLPLTQGERISMSFHPEHPNTFFKQLYLWNVNPMVWCSFITTVRWSSTQTVSSSWRMTMWLPCRKAGCPSTGWSGRRETIQPVPSRPCRWSYSKSWRVSGGSAFVLFIFSLSFSPSGYICK